MWGFNSNTPHYGLVCKRSKQAVCNTVPLWVRGFKSYLTHHIDMFHISWVESIRLPCLSGIEKDRRSRAQWEGLVPELGE